GRAGTPAGTRRGAAAAPPEPARPTRGTRAAATSAHSITTARPPSKTRATARTRRRRRSSHRLDVRDHGRHVARAIRGDPGRHGVGDTRRHADELEGAVRPLHERRAAFDPIARVAVEDALDVAELRAVDVPAYDALELASRC